MVTALASQVLARAMRLVIQSQEQSTITRALVRMAFMVRIVMTSTSARNRTQRKFVEMESASILREAINATANPATPDRIATSMSTNACQFLARMEPLALTRLTILNVDALLATKVKRAILTSTNALRIHAQKDQLALI